MAMAAASSLPPGFGGISSLVRPHERQQPAVQLKANKARKVTWAVGDRLTQIRMFLAEEAPVLAGKAQEHLQVKSSKFMRGTGDLPPGFGGGGTKVDAEALAASVVATVAWTCPQKVQLHPSWRVEAASESEEVQAQKTREMKVLEAVYPRPSAIPHSPAEPAETCEPVDDTQIPEIPVTAPDDDSDSEGSSASAAAAAAAVQGTCSNALLQQGHDQNTTSKLASHDVFRAGTGAPPTYGYDVPPQPAAASSTGPPPYGPGLTNIPGAATVASASSLSGDAILAALSQATKEQGSVIDPSLLVQFLANPSLVETLSGVRNKSMVNSSNGLNVASATPPLPPSAPPSHAQPSHEMMTRMAQSMKNLAPPSSPSSSLPSASSSSSSASAGSGGPGGVTLGFGFNKTGAPPGFASEAGIPFMHQQVGAVPRHNLIMQQLSAAPGKQSAGFAPASEGHSTGRRTRVCNYYNTAKGCRNGAKCAFLHPGVDAGGKRPLEFMVQHQQQQQPRQLIQQHKLQQQQLHHPAKRMKGWSA